MVSRAARPSSIVQISAPSTKRVSMNNRDNSVPRASRTWRSSTNGAEHCTACDRTLGRSLKNAQPRASSSGFITRSMTPIADVRAPVSILARRTLIPKSGKATRSRQPTRFGSRFIVQPIEVGLYGLICNSLGLESATNCYASIQRRRPADASDDALSDGGSSSASDIF